MCCYPSSAVSPIVPLIANFNTGPKVTPLSLLCITTGSVETDYSADLPYAKQILLPLN